MKCPCRVLARFALSLSLLLTLFFDLDFLYYGDDDICIYTLLDVFRTKIENEMVDKRKKYNLVRALFSVREGESIIIYGRG